MCKAFLFINYLYLLDGISKRTIKVSQIMEVFKRMPNVYSKSCFYKVLHVNYNEWSDSLQ